MSGFKVSIGLFSSFPSSVPPFSASLQPCQFPGQVVQHLTYIHNPALVLQKVLNIESSALENTPKWVEVGGDRAGSGRGRGW